jgi:V8-like Glu-specific endopeptidase
MLRRRIFPACLGLLLFWPSFAANGAIFDRDDRENVSTVPGSPYAPIGLVTRAWFAAYATGTLVDECHVLTSQHIFGDRKSPIGRRLIFTGARGSKQQASSRGTVIAAGGLEKHRGPGHHLEALGSDWILLRLDRCLGATLGYARLRAGPQTPFELTQLASAGYPEDRRQLGGLTIDPSCRIRAVYALVWLNDCATLHGSSGGPIFRVSTSRGKWQLEVFAMQTAGIILKRAIPFVPGWENQATPISMIAPHVQAYLSPGS